MDNIEKLLQSLQPQAVIFGGCETDGTCVTANSGKNQDLG